MASSGVRVKLERDEPGGDVDAARGRFDAALQGLLQKDEESDSENESDPDNKAKVFTKIGMSGSRSTRPPRKRRRKEIDLRDSGFHHTFVMRMFDRSVDLAQFDETSPLYPICRAWMINQPHNSSLNVKQEPGSPSTEMFNSGGEGGTGGGVGGGGGGGSSGSSGGGGGGGSSGGGEASEFPSEILPDLPPTQVSRLPPPALWPNPLLTPNAIIRDPRIPDPIPRPLHPLNEINECENTPPMLLMTEHLKRWQKIRNLWRNSSKVNDQRYFGSYTILKAMFDRAHEG